MNEIEKIGELLEKLRREMQAKIRFDKPYSDLLSCVEYIAVMQQRLKDVLGTHDAAKIYGVLRQISQMNKGLIDMGGWHEDEKISDLICRITETASAQILSGER